MQLVRGEDLSQRLDRERPLPRAVALRVAVHVAEALASAHGQGIVHRDIKPSKIMLEGELARVADFGALSRWTRRDASSRPRPWRASSRACFWPRKP